MLYALSFLCAYRIFMFFVDRISRAHVTPNIAHEVYMFQKFGMANKESILERLTPEMREWAKVEMTVEARYYHGVAPWYNTPCGIISQLVWKVIMCTSWQTLVHVSFLILKRVFFHRMSF